MAKMENIDVDIYEVDVENTNFEEYRQIYNEILANKKSDKHDKPLYTSQQKQVNAFGESRGAVPYAVANTSANITNTTNTTSTASATSTSEIEARTREAEDRAMEKMLKSITDVLGTTVIILLIALVVYNTIRFITNANTTSDMPFSETELTSDVVLECDRGDTENREYAVLSGASYLPHSNDEPVEFNID